MEGVPVCVRFLGGKKRPTKRPGGGQREAKIKWKRMGRGKAFKTAEDGGDDLSEGVCVYIGMDVCVCVYGYGCMDVWMYVWVCMNVRM